MIKAVQTNIWTRPQTEKLICLLKQNECLYNVYHLDYKNGARRSEAIREISIELEKSLEVVSEDDIRSKIHTLRTQYKKEQRKLDLSKKMGKTHVPSLWCFDKLAFLNCADLPTYLVENQNSDEEVEDPIVINANKDEASVEIELTAIQWSRSMEKVLIRQLQEHPSLFDTQHEDYRNLVKRSIAITNISKELQQFNDNVTNKEIQLKIYLLRSQFMKEYQRMQSFEKCGQYFDSSLWCFDALTFLKPQSVDDSATESTVQKLKKKKKVDEIINNDNSTIKLPKNGIWTRQLTVELIKLFKAHTNLYDVNDVKHKNVKERAVSIANISSQLQVKNDSITPGAIKTKILNLRWQHQRELRKLCHFKRRGRTYVPSLWCFDELSFLNNCYHELKNEIEDEDDIKTNEAKEEIKLKEQPTQWTRILIKKLIPLLRKNDILYNTRHLDYDNPEQRFDALHKICQELCQVDASVTVAAIGEKIESLRTQFLQEYCKVQQSLQTRDDNGEDVEAYVSSLWCYNQLLFLIPHSFSCGKNKNSANNAGNCEINLCRLCANFTNPKNSKNLFELFQQKLHGQIEELTGLHLKNTTDLPKYICKDCEEKTLQAHQFRENCIQAQQHFNTTMYRNQINAYKEELNQTEELNETMINRPKPAEDPVDYEEPMPLEELIIKEESISADEESNKAFKFLINECDEAMENDSNADDNALNIFDYNNQQGKDETSSIADIPQCNLNALSQQFVKGRKGRICDQCGKHFKVGGSNFKDHMRRHIGIKEFQCEQCSKKFMTKPELKIHTRQHTGEMPYACEYCDQRFLTVSGKIRHVRRAHTRERPFSCNVCGKTFIECGQRKEHMQTHTGERHFSCEICNVSFVLKKTLLQHYRSKTHKKNAEMHPHLVNQSDKTFDEDLDNITSS